MGSIADKLNYLVGTKGLIASALIEKGQSVQASDTFRSYASKVQAISGGGGESYPPIIASASATSTSLKLGVDTLLDDTLALSDFEITASVQGFSMSSVTRTSDLSVLIEYVLPTTEDVALTVKVLSTAFKYQKTSTASTQVKLSWLLPMIGSTDGMTEHSYTTDDGTINHSLPSDFSWPYNNSNITTLGVGGNSFIGFNSLSEAIKLNRRDTYLGNFYSQTFEKLGGTNFKCTWVGWSPYSYRTDSNKYEWELYLFCNGDAMIALTSKGAQTTFDGTQTFIATSYNRPEVGDCISFYRRNVAGTASTDWEVAYEIYNEDKSSNLVGP